MEITLRKAAYGQKSVLRNLLELYQYEFSEFDGEDVNEHGLFEYKYLDHYWTDGGRYPFFVRVDGQFAGFALIRNLDLYEYMPTYSMAEFFIMKKYRKKGIGRKVAKDLFNMFPGWWKVGQMEENIPAQAFWRKVIGEYTGGDFKEIREEKWEGPIQKFKSQ